MNTKVSIICPLYNKERYLKETLESVLQQSYSDWELIIVDDGSTDRSIEICEDFMAQNSERVIKLYFRKDLKSNKGASVCRNIGIQKSEGAYIMFLDADDLLTKSCLRDRLSEVYSGEQAFSFYVFPTAAIKKGKVIQPGIFHRILNKIESGFYRERTFYIKRFLSYELPWNISAVLWEKETLVEMNGFNETFQRFQDPELHVRALLNEKNTFKITNGEYDFLHRRDEDVHDKKALQFYIKRIKSVNHFIDYFVPQLINKNKFRLALFMQGYFLFAERLVMIGNSSKISTEDKNEINRLMKELYQNENVQKIANSRYFRFLNRWKKSKENKYFSVLKFPYILRIFYFKTLR